MVKMNENGRKEYKQPKMQVIEIATADIIASSDPFAGNDDM